MTDFIVLVILIWVMTMFIGDPLRRLIRSVVATIGGAILFLVFLVAHMFVLSIILAIILVLYIIYRLITRPTRNHQRRGRNNHWPPMPPL